MSAVASSSSSTSASADGNCPTCGKSLTSQPTVAFDGKLYHTMCLKCTRCKKVIDACDLLAFQQKPFHERCFEDYEASQSAVSCPKCKKPVPPFAASTIEAMARFWHAECFVCSKCNDTILPAEPYFPGLSSAAAVAGPDADPPPPQLFHEHCFDSVVGLPAAAATTQPPEIVGFAEDPSLFLGRFLNGTMTNEHLASCLRANATLWLDSGGKAGVGRDAATVKAALNVRQTSSRDGEKGSRPQSGGTARAVAEATGASKRPGDPSNKEPYLKPSSKISDTSSAISAISAGTIGTIQISESGAAGVSRASTAIPNTQMQRAFPKGVAMEDDNDTESGMDNGSSPSKAVPAVSSQHLHPQDGGAADELGGSVKKDVFHREKISGAVKNLAKEEAAEIDVSAELAARPKKAAAVKK